jgi:DNA-binding LacI/PurR family transcriptional regulator
VAELNIHDLAKRLDISIGTVSRALNGKADVNAKTRQRVLAAAQKYGYSPNQSGRSLRQGSTGLVGFIINIDRERETRGEAFFMSVFEGMQSYLARQGFDLVVHFNSSDEDPLTFLKRIVERRLVDGLIISHTYRTDMRIDYLVERKMPFISFGRSKSNIRNSWIDLDFEGVAKQGIDHLVALGHRDIAVVSAENDINYGYIFLNSCRKNLARHGLDLPEHMIFKEALTEKGGYNVGQRILAMKRRPTAIVLVDNTMAIGLYHLFQDSNVVPGRDIAVVGFEGSPNREFLRPSLTQFRLSLPQIGEWLGNHIIENVRARNSGAEPKKVTKLWPMEMVVGDSSRLPFSQRQGSGT